MKLSLAALVALLTPTAVATTCGGRTLLGAGSPAPYDSFAGRCNKVRNHADEAELCDTSYSDNGGKTKCLWKADISKCRDDGEFVCTPGADPVPSPSPSPRPVGSEEPDAPQPECADPVRRQQVAVGGQGEPEPPRDRV